MWQSLNGRLRLLLCHRIICTRNADNSVRSIGFDPDGSYAASALSPPYEISIKSLCFEISESTVSKYVVTKCVDHRDIDAETASHGRLVRTLAAETCDEIITNHSFA